MGVTVSRQVFDQLKALTEQELVKLRPLIDERAISGVPRDTHGDLHLDHVYLFPDREPPGDLVIIDCIEFNERFRFADPVSDMAFLAMDLKFHGRRDLAEMFTESYFASSGDRDGRALLPFYTAYRAAVRGKVEGFELLENEVPQAERDDALTRRASALASGIGRTGATRPQALSRLGWRFARHWQINPCPALGGSCRFHRGPLRCGSQRTCRRVSAFVSSIQIRQWSVFHGVD